jgi:hypothetical protein
MLPAGLIDTGAILALRLMIAGIRFARKHCNPPTYRCSPAKRFDIRSAAVSRRFRFAQAALAGGSVRRPSHGLRRYHTGSLALLRIVKLDLDHRPRRF